MNRLFKIEIVRPAFDDLYEKHRRTFGVNEERRKPQIESNVTKSGTPQQTRTEIGNIINIGGSVINSEISRNRFPQQKINENRSLLRQYIWPIVTGVIAGAILWWLGFSNK